MNSDRNKRVRALEDEVASLRKQLGEVRAHVPISSWGATPDQIVQSITDIGVEQVGARFGAFLYDWTDERGEPMMLYALSGALREAFEGFPPSGSTQLFPPTFDSASVVRSDDLLVDPRYAHGAPQYGIPPGSLPVRSYLAAPVISSAGQVLGGLFFSHPEPNVFSERSERMIARIAPLAAIALENANLLRAAVNSERRFKALIENSTDGIVVVDASQKIVYVSPSVATIEGYEACEMIGMSPDERMHPDDLPKVEADFQRVLANPAAKVSSIVRRRHKDGRWLWLEGILINLLDDPAVRGIVINFRNVTERKRSEEALIRSQKMEALGTLAGGIAHDFNNLLLAIVGNTKLAMADLNAEHPAQESLAQVAKAGHRGTDLVARILAFSRQQEAKRDVTDLRTIVDDALRLLRATLPAMVAIKVSCEPGVPAIEADSSQMHQVILNLVANAAYAIGNRAGTVEVDVREVTVDDALAASSDLRAGRFVRLSVSDDGCGMNHETLRRVFDPFFTTKPPGQGSGLGLSVAHGIVKAHDGTILAYSQPGKGSVFHVYLPASTKTLASKKRSAQQVNRGRGERVLYIDDDTAIVFLTGRILERLGYQVTGCEGPQEGLNAFRAAPDKFDVVVTDLSMPGMSGFDVARELRSMRTDIPILMTSGYVRPEDREAAQQRGIRDLILKPNTVEELGESLHRLFLELRGQRAP